MSSKNNVKITLKIKVDKAWRQVVMTPLLLTGIDFLDELAVQLIKSLLI